MSTLDDETLAHRDPSLPVDERVARLLGLMTIEEKVAQLGSAWVFELASHGHLDSERATPCSADGLGQVTRISGASSLDATQAAVLANEIQRHLVEHTRLGIPAIVHEEICSGLMAREATVFPQAIGVAATFRPEHNHAITDAIRRQMRAMRRPPRPVAGARHLPRSPLGSARGDVRRGSRSSSARWAWPTSAACRATTSATGSSPPPSTSSATARRRAASTGRRRTSPSASSATCTCARSRRRFATPAWLSVMNGYHELDGVPCGANRWLLTELLRDEWGFDGIVVSDYFAVDQLDGVPPHRQPTEPTPRRPRCTPGSTSSCPAPTASPGRCTRLWRAARSTIADVDQAVRRVLDDEVPSRSVRAAVRRRRPGGAPHPHRRPARPRPAGGARQPRAAARTTAHSRWRRRVRSP